MPSTLFAATAMPMPVPHTSTPRFGRAARHVARDELGEVRVVHAVVVAGPRSMTSWPWSRRYAASACFCSKPAWSLAMLMFMGGSFPFVSLLSRFPPRRAGGRPSLGDRGAYLAIVRFTASAQPAFQQLGVAGVLHARRVDRVRRAQVAQARGVFQKPVPKPAR